MEKPPKKLFLLDAMALIYRAHFAFSKFPRMTSKGMSTGAAFGFTNTLLEILNKEKPTHIAVGFDTKAPTFRHVEFTEYKANRDEQPEDITVAIPFVKKILNGFRIPVLELDGYEADDIIGTIAKKVGQEGFDVFMMTPDKDYAQLVNEHVFLYKPNFMGKGVDIFDTKKVLEKWEIKDVSQVTDILGLQGDAVDNIPGIPGVGEKTAKKLIAEFGSVENLIQNADKALKGKLRENVINFAEQGLLSKKLATINTEVPVEWSVDDFEIEEIDKDALAAVFEELEFRTLKKRVFGEESVSEAPKKEVKSAEKGQISIFDAPQAVNVDPPVGVPVEETSTKDTIDSNPHDYRLIDTPKRRASLISYLTKQKEFCFDTETDALESTEARLVGIAFSYYPGDAYYVPVPEGEEGDKIAEEFRKVFENEEIRKIGQNIKYDITVLKNHGIDVKGPLFDTMLAHYLIDPETRHNMDVLAENFLNYTPVSITELIGKKGANQGNMRDLLPEQVKEYAGEDADITLQLKYTFDPLIKKSEFEKLFYDIELPLVHVLSDMEIAGVRVDPDTLKEFSESLEKESRIKEKEIYDAAGTEFNIASPKQLGEVLFDKLKLVDKPKKTKTGQYATGEEILSKLANEHKICSDILEFREYQKLKSTYADALPLLISPRDGRIHTSYNQAVAATGRLSSVNPNLQNIPIRTEKGREIRKAFIPRDENHILLSADYSQIELRIMAAFSGDKTMIEAFRQGTDIHATTASKVFKVPVEEVTSEMRRKAKTVNFGIIYGISAFGLSQRMNIPRREAADIIDAYFKEFPSVSKYMNKCIENTKEKEFTETITGRRRYLKDINSRNAVMRGFAERNAVNAPIQGSAADIIKKAMIDIHNHIKAAGLKSKMILQVHDELVFDVHQSEINHFKKMVPQLMKDAMPLDVPMEVEVGTGTNWLEAH